MPAVLVVDKHTAHRKRISQVLAGHPELRLDWAESCSEAFEKLDSDGCDLVLLDLDSVAPHEKDFIAQLRAEGEAIPVVLLTSPRFEELATEFLRQGAASYVPRRVLAGDLAPTIKGVLAVAIHKKFQSRLVDSLEEATYRFVLDNSYDRIPPLVGYLEEAVQLMGICDETDAIRVSIGLQEALANSLYHGNLEMESEMREEGHDLYLAEAERRAALAPYKTRRIHVEARLSRSEAVFMVRDEGLGFDPADLPDPTDPANIEKISGRGIMLMTMMMDRVTFSEHGRRVVMVKRRADQPSH